MGSASWVVVGEDTIHHSRIHDFEILQMRYRKYGPATEAPNRIQRWFLVDAPLLIFAGLLSAVLILICAVVLVAKGGTYDGVVAPLVIGVWLGTTLVFSFGLILVGWPSNRGNRMVRYLGRGVPVSDDDEQP